MHKHCLERPKKNALGFMNAISLHSYVTMYKNYVHNSKCNVGLFLEYHVSCMLEKIIS